MHKALITSKKKILVGITVRTNNANEINWQNGNAKIFPCVQRYFGEQLANSIPHRARPGVTYCAYTQYESDHTGEYTYFIGEEVTAAEPKNLPAGFTVLEVPAQTYARFTTEPGNMPEVLRTAWFAIWNMSDQELGGKRSYAVDYELYDERAQTPDHTGIVLDIFIGIQKAL